MQQINGMEAENQIDGSDEEGNLPILTPGKILIQKKRVWLFFVAL